MLVPAAGCGGNDKEGGNASTGVNPNLPANEQLLFSFENYDEMHSTIRKTYNKVGVLSVSDEHVTAGNKSMKVEVMGTYNQANRPGFDLFCTQSDFTSDDFSQMESLKMDVYNANDEELSIGVYFNVTLKADFSKNGNTPSETFTLAPNATTTIEYEIPDINAVCDMESVNYIHIEFNQSMENAEDTPNVFYFDCVRGKQLDVPREEGEEVNMSFTDGFYFENLAEVMLMPTFDGFDSSWAKYEKEGVDTPEELGLGEYGLKTVNPNAKFWPGFVIDLGESFEVGTTVTFRTYVKVDGEDVIDGAMYRIEGFSDTAKTYTHKAEADYLYNNWLDVTITFTGKSQTLWLFYNFRSDATGQSIFSSTDYAVYIDCFKVTPPAAAPEA